MRIPELMRSGLGEPVTTCAKWQTERRPELLRLLEAEEYGCLPKDLHCTSSEIEACRWAEGYRMQRVSLCCGAFHFQMEAYVPDRSQKCPAVLYLLLHGEAPAALPILRFMSAGCAFAFVSCDQLAEDSEDAQKTGLLAYLKETCAAPVTAGALAAWAWGLAQARDVLATHPAIDPRRITLAGYSRGGKAALWSCARYGGYGLCVAVHSGCGGASLFRTIPKGMERLADIVRSFPYWFSQALAAYGGREAALPFDQHMLLALCAPCPLLILDADRDPYCSASSDSDSVRLAQPAFRLAGGTLRQAVGSGDHTFRANEWEQILQETLR